MSGDVAIRVEGAAGRITLARPEVLNALSWDMCLAIEAALDAWSGDAAVRLVVIDAEGDRAFCSGGDIAEMYATGTRGDFGYGRRFWADEYRMNAKLFRFPKPVVTFLQGFTMGGGVGVGCHGSHRIVCETSRIAMPEVGIGLVPDVGGSLLLARAPGRLGEYLGATAFRMGPGNAILAEFADYYIPEANWAEVKRALVQGGAPQVVDDAGLAAPEAPLAAQLADIDDLFAGEGLRDIVNACRHSGSDFAQDALERMGRGAPLSVACAIELVHRARVRDTVEAALTQEYRFTARAMEHGDFLEGIRAAIIDKDRRPRWQHGALDAVPAAEVARMLMPLGDAELTL